MSKICPIGLLKFSSALRKDLVIALFVEQIRTYFEKV